MICTASSNLNDLPETISTLRFADNAKQIVNRPVANIKLTAEQLEVLLKKEKERNEQLTKYEYPAV